MGYTCSWDILAREQARRVLESHPMGPMLIKRALAQFSGLFVSVSPVYIDEFWPSRYARGI